MRHGGRIGCPDEAAQVGHRRREPSSNDLYDVIHGPAVLAEAGRRVLCNEGSPRVGVDAKTTDYVRDLGRRVLRANFESTQFRASSLWLNGWFGIHWASFIVSASRLCGRPWHERGSGHFDSLDVQHHAGCDPPRTKAGGMRRRQSLHDRPESGNQARPQV